MLDDSLLEDFIHSFFGYGSFSAAAEERAGQSTNR